MITKNELKEYCVLTGFNLWQTERDYLQHLFLIFLSKHSSNELLFKGGTALQKVYGLNRFSIDLDFTQIKGINFAELMDKVTKNITDFGYTSKFEEIKTLGNTFKLKVHGPLYNNTQISASNISIEISQRENMLLEPQLKQIIPFYNDLQPYSLFVMQETEILAEKVRAIMSRNKPRDVFDLNFLLRRGIKFDLEFINKKLIYYNQKFDKKEFAAMIKENKLIWGKEMKNYLNTVPDFDSVLAYIMENLKLI